MPMMPYGWTYLDGRLMRAPAADVTPDRAPQHAIDCDMDEDCSCGVAVESDAACGARADDDADPGASPAGMRVL